MEETNGKLSSLINKNSLSVLLGVAGLIFFSYGLISSTSPKKDKPDILFEAAKDTNPSAMVTKEVKELAVDVEGAVLKPGVYKLKEDSRMQDAIVAAGGISEEADREKVAKTLNLAAKISDGAKIYIPFIGEEIAAAEGSSQATVMGESIENFIDINTASSGELEALPGIGEVTAAKIIDNRPYGSIQELLDKKIVGQSTFDKIRDKVIVN